MHEGAFHHGRHAAVLAVAAGTVLVLVGCGTAGTGSAPAAGATVEVVTSTDVYGDIAHAIGGDKVHVTPIIHTTGQDPHSYQATTQDKLAVSKARLLIENGGGYDDFFSTLATDTSGDRQLIDVTRLSGLSPQPTTAPDFNEHLWYNFDTMTAVAETVCKDLAGIDPADTATYTANTERFKVGLAKLKDRVTALKAHHTGDSVAITEPVPLYLLQAAGLVNKTPAEYSRAVEAGHDVPVSVMKDTLDLISGKSVKFLAYNNQTEGPQTTALKDAATNAGVSVIGFTETLPEGQTYLQWMSANVDHIEKALQG